ncbi:MAG: DNA recombination protein RmuC [Rhodospirillales bacterium]
MLSSFTLTDLLLTVLVLAVLAVLTLLLARRGRNPPGEDFAARIDRLQVDTVQRVMEQLQAQERHVREALDQRLTALQSQLGERLDKGQAETSKTVVDLRERLVRIDEAQKAMGQLSSQVLSLQEVLSNKQARGAFGEVQLNDLVVAILPPSAYAFQASLSNSARVDCLLQLPNPPGPIAIDAKFPLESYRALHAATDDAQRTIAARAFRQAVGKHIADIAGKYILAGETAESALMFLPSEAVYAELHTNFLDVVDASYRARVYIVSPTTLMATLNTVRAVLKDVKMREQAGLIQKEVGLLLGDVERLSGRVESLRRHFGQANTDIEQIVTSAGKIAGRGEKIQSVELQDGAQPSLLPPA